MCGFLCIMEALAISGYVTFADQDGKTQAICRDASAANLTLSLIHIVVYRGAEGPEGNHEL